MVQVMGEHLFGDPAGSPLNEEGVQMTGERISRHSPVLRSHRCAAMFKACIMLSTPCVILMLLCCFTGCGSTPKPKPQQPDFLDRWKLLAQESQGHSPSARERPTDGLPRAQQPTSTQVISAEQDKPLPKQKVSLRMHNADLVVVLRALARAVSLNILINDKVKGSTSVDVEAVPWDQAFRGILRLHGLTYAWEGELIRIMTIEDLENEVKIQKVGYKNIEPLHLKVIPIDYSDASKLQEKLKEYLTKDDKGVPRGSISVDEHTNSLVINAIPEDIAMLTRLIGELDKPTPQILIKSTIVEANRETAYALGVQWGGFYKDGDLFITPGGTGGRTEGNGVQYNPSTGQTGISGQGFGVNLPVDLLRQGFGGSLGLMVGTIGGNILDMQLSALQREGKLNILSSPSITTLDNQVAFTEDGEKVPYVSTSELAGTEVKFEDAVLRLEIKPHVIGDDYLRMEITVRKDEVDPTRNVQGNPFIIKKHTKTTLIAKDGETIVISGLSKSTQRETDRSIPGFRKTPLISRLFRYDDQGSQMQEVLIFITPHILKEHRAALKELPR